MVSGQLHCPVQPVITEGASGESELVTVGESARELCSLHGSVAVQNKERMNCNAERVVARGGGGNDGPGRNPGGVDEPRMAGIPRVAHGSQPWARGHNPFGIEDPYNQINGLEVYHCALLQSGMLTEGASSLPRRSRAVASIVCPVAIHWPSP